MDYKELLKDLNIIKNTLDEFEKKHGEEIAEFISKRDISEEENLIASALASIYEKTINIRFTIDKLQAPVKREGILTKNTDGEICLNGEPLPLLTDLEVLVHDEFNRGWTPAFIGTGESGPFLVGVDRDTDINGIKARIK